MAKWEFTTPIWPDTLLTPEQMELYAELQAIVNSYYWDGNPISHTIWEDEDGVIHMTTQFDDDGPDEVHKPEDQFYQEMLPLVPRLKEDGIHLLAPLPKVRKW